MLDATSTPRVPDSGIVRSSPSGEPARTVRNVHVRVGDGSLGWENHAPYDRILLTAVCRDGIPERLQGQLKEDGGLLVAPVESGGRQEIVLVETRRGSPVTKRVEACGFVPLVEGAADPTLSGRGGGGFG